MIGEIGSFKLKKLLLILLCLPFIGFGQCISGDCEDGYGTYTWASGDKYVGEFKDGIFYGQGTFTFPDGENYVGQWKDDQQHGQGTYTYSIGNKYVGEWKDDKKSGQGTFTWANGDKYVGEFKDGIFHGQGTCTFVSGNKYVGEWKDDNMSGQGTYTYANGDKYVGEFKDGNKDGQGTVTWPNGAKYVGEFKNDMPNGQGTIQGTMTNDVFGSNYIGEFKDGMPNGQGTKTWVNGDKYVGHFAKGNRHGYGTQIYANGMEYVGEWKNDLADYKETKIGKSSVDKNIPINSKVKNRYALIIGNEDYTSFQRTLSSEQNVDYAVNDATIFKQYCLNTLGVKEENMFFLTNATAGQMSQEIDLVSQVVQLEGDKAELIVYYAGHGYPDELTKVPYLIPVDISASNLSSGIKLDDLYQKLTNTNASKITIFLDACFTGGGRNSGLVASRGVKVNPKQGTLNGNIVVFSASSEEQSSLPYHDEGHGIFTYFLLMKFQETKGSVSLGDLSEYLEKEVAIQSLKVNRQPQNPTVNTSQKVFNDWRNWKF
jgi:hypothetical protein